MMEPIRVLTCRRAAMIAAFFAAMFLAFPVLFGQGGSLQSQDLPPGSNEVGGFWIGFGGGAAWSEIDCTPCGSLEPDDPWEGGSGFGLYLAMGGTLAPGLRIGGELNLYGKRNRAQRRDATLGGLSAVILFHPRRAASGPYVKGGAGLGGSIMAGGPGLIESGGWAMQAGAGHDFSLGRRVVAPFFNVVQVFSEGDPGRNRGEPAHGPRNPRFVQLGVALHRY